jgi:hypothetical protein
MRSALPFLLLVGLTACYDDDDDGGDCCPIPTFVELEPNDDPADANYMGVIAPGDRFFIEGFVRDDLGDPFDGFAFTANQPLHVDFQLFMESTAVDLDICLYDPQLGQTLACWATDQQPERGGVDVDTGGLDFHLVVESFIGDASYSLEIVVQPFLAREALDADAPRIRATDVRTEREAEAPQGYREPERGVARRIEQYVELDPVTGALIEIVRVMGR